MKRSVNIVAYIGSCPDQNSIWAGAKGLADNEIKLLNLPYEIKFTDIKTEDIHRGEVKYPSGNGPVPPRSSTTEYEFAAKFSEADIHIFVDHPHQGNIRYLEWDMDILKNELMVHLKDHPGFPTGKQIMCYVFLQDKVGYIEKAPHFFLPTLKVNLKEFNENDIGMFNEIYHFLNLYPGSPFVVKTGYTTNSHLNSLRCSGPNEVYNRLQKLCLDHLIEGTGQLKFSYAFIQKKVENTREHKLLFFNKEFQYVQKICKGSGALSHSDEEILEFAKKVMDYYVDFVPEIITQGIIRIDIMEDDEKRLFVNELESLAANISSNQGTIELIKYSQLKTSVSNFYKDIVVNCVRSL